MRRGSSSITASPTTCTSPGLTATTCILSICGVSKTTGRRSTRDPSMGVYVLRRLLWMLVAIIGVSVVTFAFIYLIPGDPARALAGPHASADTIASIRHQLGLDQPIDLQYAHYAWRALHGDFVY